MEMLRACIIDSSDQLPPLLNIGNSQAPFAYSER